MLPSLKHHAERCKEVMQVVNEILEQPETQNAVYEDPVNWGDLSCVEVLRTVSTKGVAGWVVYIEEASPASWRLKGYIAKKLSERMGGNVIVHTEW